MEERKTAYKGFKKDLSCRDFQYEVGKEYEHQGIIELCESGFHACENPFDVLSYYDDMLDNRYCEVEQSGQIKSDDKKSASSKISIKAEIGFAGLFKAGIEYIKEKTDPKKIEPSTDGLDDNGRYCAQIGSSGDCAQIGSSGDGAQIDSSGEDSVICCAGHGSMAKAKVGSWITLAEWEYSEFKKRLIPKCVKTEYVDGERIKADTWYGLKDGEFYEIKE